MKVKFFVIPHGRTVEEDERAVNAFLAGVEVRQIFQTAASVTDPQSSGYADNPNYRVVAALLTIFYEEKEAAA